MSDATSPRGQSIDAVLANFQRRILQDALSEQTARYWRRRADQLEAARPRPDEYAGRATPEMRRAAWERLTLMALNCRRHADLIDEARRGL